ncbi:hypothetical protein D3C85_1229130 [compost metagenome]
MKKNRIRAMVNTMFSSLSSLTPRLTPDTAENTATAVITAINPSCTNTELSRPSSRLRPALICCAPRPSEVATPKMVARIARMSTACPQGPSMARPNRGRRVERMVSGRPLRKAA